MNETDPEAAIQQWLAAQHDAMVALLRELVNTDGGSYDKAGVDAVGDHIRRFLTAHGIVMETLPQQRFGDCLRATAGGASGGGGGRADNLRRNIVLMGHRDTVFPTGEPTRRPFRIQGDRAFGPGVCDMKAGLVMNMFILVAFQTFGGAPGPLVGLFTADEEIGSPEGRPVIEAQARQARAVFNSEPGRPTGAVVTGRKGGVFMTMDIHGRAAHSGSAYEQGISAIDELAHKIVALHDLTDLPRGITVNVGLVSGGQSTNTVAPRAQGRIDLRYVEQADRAAMLARIREVVERSFVPGAQATLTIESEFLPLTPSPAARRLFEGYRAAAAESGLNVAGEFAGGCADSGFTAAVGAPTLCGVGPVGGNAHTPDEYVDLASIVPRAQTLARTILHLDAMGI